MNPSRFFAYMIALFVLALALHMVHSLWFLGLGVDNLRQLGAAQNLVDGHGLVVRRYDPTNRSEGRRGLALQWAPGYSLFVAALQRTGMAPLTAVRSLSVLAASLFLLAWFAWLVTLRPLLGDSLTYVGGLIAVGTVLPLQILPAVDGLSLALFLGLSFLVHRISVSEKPGTPWEWGLLAAASLCLILLRYAYWPLVIAMGFVGYRVSPRCRRFPSALWFWAPVIALVAVGIGLVLSGVIRQPWPDGGLHWNNLVHVRPFPAFAFGLNRGLLLLADRVILPPWAATWINRIFALVLGFGWIVAGVRGLKRKEGRAFTLVSLVTVGVTVGLVGLASLTVDSSNSLINNPSLATPVKDGRYFAPCVPFLALGWLVATATGTIPRWLGWTVLVVALGVGAPARGLMLEAPLQMFSAPRESSAAFRFREIRQLVIANRKLGRETYWISGRPELDDDYAVANGAILVEPKWASWAMAEAFGPFVYSAQNRYLPVP